MSTALIGSLESGVIFALMALGVYLTFRILNFPDLTVDGSFTSGGSLAATLIAAGTSPFLATVSATLLGCLVGCITGLLHTKGKINPLLAGILSMIALYSVNLRIMGKANVPLLSQDTLITQISSKFGAVFGSYSIVIVLGVFALLMKFAMDWFLRTEIGLSLRATGDNEKMIRSFSANTDQTKIIGLGLSNALVAMSGAIWSQYQGFADVSMGIGMIVIGLASVIIGEAVLGDRTIGRATLAVVAGAILYRMIVALALQIGLNPSDMKLMTALIVIAALIAPRVLGPLKKRGRNGRTNAPRQAVSKGRE